MKRPYSEGSVFSVPLRDSGVARGVVARATSRGRVLMGYFFGPRLSSHDAVKLDDLNPANAILRTRFGDLGLINGEWRIHGKVPDWNRSEWPIPNFVRRDPLGKRKAVLIVYSDVDPLRIQAEYPIEDTRGLQPDLMSGYGAVEIRLTKLLRPQVGNHH